MATLPIIVVVDVDPDYRLPGMSGRPWSGELSWRGLKEGVPQMLELVGSLKDSFGQPVRFTWLLRSDPQMAALTGDPAFLAEEFSEFWQERVRLGDEVGWHPHLYRLAETANVWYQETRDVDWIDTALREGHSALARHFPLKSGKMGWTFHTTESMTTFDDLGLLVDASALPGMGYAASIPGTGLPFGVYDWSRAPPEPYHPSRNDYQLSVSANALRILEVPTWTFPLGHMREMLHVLRHRSTRDFANPAKSHPLMKPAFGRPPWTLPFVCYLHPEELLGYAKLFSADHVPINLSTLLESCTLRRLETRFTTLDRLVRENG